MHTNIIKLTSMAKYGKPLATIRHTLQNNMFDLHDLINHIHEGLSVEAEDKRLYCCGDSQILSFSVSGEAHVFKVSTKELTCQLSTL